MTLDSLDFISPTKGPVSMEELIAGIENFVKEDQSSFYHLVIGTDSQAKTVNGKSQIDYVTALIIHREGKGAQYYWRKFRVFEKPILQKKIFTETTTSLEIAELIVPKLREAVRAAKYDLEIHIDVGALGPTRDLIKDVVGMVVGSGYVAKTKPESWGASHVADKHT